jgi:hypothetical protein
MAAEPQRDEVGAAAIGRDTPGMLRDICAPGQTPAIIPAAPKLRVNRSSSWWKLCWDDSLKPEERIECKEKMREFGWNVAGDAVLAATVLLAPPAALGVVIGEGVWTVGKSATAQIDGARKQVAQRTDRQLKEINSLNEEHRKSVDELIALRRRGAIDEADYQRRLAELNRQHARDVKDMDALRPPDWHQLSDDATESREAQGEANKTFVVSLIGMSAGKAIGEHVGEAVGEHVKLAPKGGQLVLGMPLDELPGDLAVARAYQELPATAAGKAAEESVNATAETALDRKAREPGRDLPQPVYIGGCPANARR